MESLRRDDSITLVYFFILTMYFVRCGYRGNDEFFTNLR